MMYKCPHCGKVMERDSTKAWIKSFCEWTGKHARLQRVKALIVRKRKNG